MVAIGAMLLVLAAVSSTAAEHNGDVCVEVGAHHCETKHLSLIQTQTEIFHRGTPVQPVLATSTATQPAMNAADGGGLLVDSSTSNKCSAAMLVILPLLLGILIWTQRDRLQNSSKTELVATSCVLLYIIATISLDVLIRKFHQQGVNTAFLFSPAVLALLGEVGKLIVMIVGACVDWKNTCKCSLAEFATTMRLMSLPAACFVTLNILQYSALSGADLDQYRVWRSTDIIFVACIWCTMFKKTPGVKEIAGIGLVCLSCAMMGFSAYQHRKSSGETSPVSIITTMVLALLSSLGLVLNEFGLKASTQLSLFVQNIALYSLTIVLNSVFVLATVPTGQIFQGINSPQMALIGVDVVLGVSVGCVLKYADSIVKMLASGALAPLEPLVGHFLVGTPVTPAMVVATVFAGAGSIIYKFPEGKSEDKKEDVQSATVQSATGQKEQN